MNGSILQLILPEVVLASAGCVLFLFGVSRKLSVRRLAPWLALATLVLLFALQTQHEARGSSEADASDTVRLNEFAYYIRMLVTGVGILLVLIAWPSNPDGTGSPAMNFGADGGEFFGLLLLSLAGVLLVASANDMILLFLGIELAALPTYVMVSISRPLPVAQEAGVKYFFLGAMAAALLLFGFSYLYGATGTTNMYAIAAQLHSTISGVGAPSHLSTWEMLAVVMLIAGLAFKLAAVPLHFYAADVYQGAATPVSALLAFVPKTSGMVALIKILFVAGGGGFDLPGPLVKLLWVLAVLTMFTGNVLGLLQQNVKRVLAYSSIAHSGYLLVGVAALCGAQGDRTVQEAALGGVLFYLAAYGIMNTAAFGVLLLLPSHDQQPATSAETFEDLAGQGRRHVALGLAMAISCFSLIGIPLTVGFFGKFLLIKPAFGAGMIGLVILTVINAAISAAYYLRIVATMFLRDEPSPGIEVTAPAGFTLPIVLSVILSCGATLLFGTVPPATQVLSTRAQQGSVIDDTVPATQPVSVVPGD